MKKFLILLVFLLLFPFFAKSYEIYRIVNNNCEESSGFMIGADLSALRLLKLDGHYSEIPKSEIKAIFIFNTINNPVEKIILNDPLIRLARKIFIRNEDSPLMTGWPVQFIENLVVFYDLTGKLHVVDLYDITKIRPLLDLKSSTVLMDKFEVKQLQDFHGTLDCKPEEGAIPEMGGIPPSRIISDKIKIHEFIAKYMDGFERFESYKERTYLYARPLLFPQRTRLGFMMMKDFLKNFSNGMFPLYFQWSNGSPYRFQSFSTIGGQYIDLLPSLETTFAIRSEVKSHIFNAAFVGNIAALPAGTSVFSENLQNSDNTELDLKIGFNYMALMGFDYTKYSFSIGTLFPSFFLKFKEETREILATSVSPVLKISYTEKKIRIRTTGSLTEINHDTFENDENLLSVASEPVKKFSLKSQYLRTSIDYIFSEEFEVGGDYLFIHSDYDEKTENWANGFSYLRNGGTVYLYQQFGHYIALKGFLQLISTRYKGNLKDSTLKDWQFQYIYGGHFELLF